MGLLERLGYELTPVGRFGALMMAVGLYLALTAGGLRMDTTTMLPGPRNKVEWTAHQVKKIYATMDADDISSRLGGHHGLEDVGKTSGKYGYWMIVLGVPVFFAGIRKE